jgi:integrase
MVSEFFSWLNSRSKNAKVTTVIKPITEHLHNKMKQASEMGIERHSLINSCKEKSRISYKVARTICKHLQIKMSDYFLVEKKEERYAKATNAGIRQVFVSIMNSAVGAGLLAENVASKTKVPNKGSEKKKTPYNKAETIIYINAVNRESIIRRKTLYALKIYMAPRMEETIALEWKDFNFSTKQMTIQRVVVYSSAINPETGQKFGLVTLDRAKTDAGNRTIPIPEEMFKILVAYKAWWDEQKAEFGFDTDRLFFQDCTYLGQFKSLHPSTVNSWLRPFLFKAGLRHISAHYIRHTAITHMCNLGIPVKVVAKYVGHEDYRTTLKIYTHANEEELEKAAEAYGNMLSAKTGTSPIGQITITGDEYKQYLEFIKSTGGKQPIALDESYDEVEFAVG